MRGPLELEVRFRNANALCYEYSTNVAASRMAASDQPLPTRVPGIGAFGAASSASFATLEDALSALNNSQTDLDEILNAARIQMSLDDVWAACDGGGDFATQRARVESAARMAAERLGVDGAWRQVLENAEAISLGGKRLSRELATGEHDATQEVESRKTALSDAERKEREVRESAARSGRTKKVQEDIDDAARALAAAQRKLREGELNLNRHRRSGDLGRAAEQLGERVHHALETLSANVAEINRARSLLARSPTAIRRRFGPGENVAVVVERTRLDHGERVQGRGPQLFEVPAYVTLHSVILDIGIGPALGIGHNTAKFETVFSPASSLDPYPAWRILRTEQGLPLDAMLSLSAYIWQERYFDGVVFDAMQLVPRPMIGMSVAHPLDEFYAGFQIDPIQYLDISGGVRFANEQKLIGPRLLDRALVDGKGQPQPPVTRDEILASGFIAVTVSTNLLYSWVRQAL